jgi:leucyl/phenylalanyl-tRNA--protein transferase
MSLARPVPTILVDALLDGYRRGRFPMCHEDGEIYWHDPDPRAVFPLATLQPDAVTARQVRSGRYRCTLDTAFEQVIRSCADRPETWLDERMIRSYIALHEAGHAHSVECWAGDQLVGGIYGVSLGAAFFGESMFGRQNAGKVAFHSLAGRLQQAGYLLFDTQYINPFTAHLGATEVPRAQFRRSLATALASQPTPLCP